jgi:hypothetical protein
MGLRFQYSLAYIRSTDNVSASFDIHSILITLVTSCIPIMDSNQVSELL